MKKSIREFLTDEDILNRARQIASKCGFDVSGGIHDDNSLILDCELIVDEEDILPDDWEDQLKQYCVDICNNLNM